MSILCWPCCARHARVTADPAAGVREAGRRQPTQRSSAISSNTSVCLAELATPECARAAKPQLPGSKDAEGEGDEATPLGADATSTSPCSPDRCAPVGATVQGGNPLLAASEAADSAARLSECTELPNGKEPAAKGRVTLRSQPESATEPGAAAPRVPKLRSALASRPLPNLVTSWARVSEPADPVKGGTQFRFLIPHPAL